MKRVLALPAVLLAAASPPLPPASLAGTWTNPSASIKVRTGRCGEGVCGWIVWTNAAAAADAREAGISNPIGIEVLRDYRADPRGGWRGTVYVADMGRSFSSRLERTGPDTLRISGCLVAGFLCRSQTWRRS